MSWRWVMNVVAPMITIRTADRIFVDVAEALSRCSVCVLELNEDPMGTPKILANEACLVASAVRIPWKCEVKQPAAWTSTQPFAGCRLLSTRNKAKNTGICTMIGRQPANGL